MLIFSYRRTELSSRLWNAANSAYGYYVDVHEKPEKGGERFEHGDVLYRGTIREQHRRQSSVPVHIVLLKPDFKTKRKITHAH